MRVLASEATFAGTVTIASTTEKPGMRYVVWWDDEHEPATAPVYFTNEDTAWETFRIHAPER